MKFIDAVSDAFGWLAGWLFFVIGVMICYEVIARYVFVSPTVWAEEMSRFLQIWAVYIGAAYVLRHHHLIRITLLMDRLGPAARRIGEAFTLLWIAAFALIAMGWGAATTAESISFDRHTSTMLAVPQWLTEIAIPLGCVLLVLQCAVELLRLWRADDVDYGRIEQQL